MKTTLKGKVHGKTKFRKANTLAGSEARKRVITYVYRLRYEKSEDLMALDFKQKGL